MKSLKQILNLIIILDFKLNRKFPIDRFIYKKSHYNRAY